MTEREMEDLLWNHPEKFLNERLRQFNRQQRSTIGRSDLIFVDGLDRFLVVEIEKGKLSREAIFQVTDYFGVVKKEHPDKPVKLMVIANAIPDERRLACERQNITWVEVPEKRFRDVAELVGYPFASEPSNSESGEKNDSKSSYLVRMNDATKLRQHGITHALRRDFDRQQLASLIGQFSSVIRRQRDNSLAIKLRRDFLESESNSLSRDTVYQLAKWCKTTNPLYFDGMEVARRISTLRFGVVVDRDEFERKR